MEASKHSILTSPNPSTEHLLTRGSYRYRHYTFCGTSLAKGYLVNSERRKRYPNNWDDLSWQCKERAGWKCAFCHVTQGRKRKSKRTGQWYRVYLHAAHRDHDLSNPHPALLCLCPTCHGTYDYRYRMSQHQVNLERMK